VGAGVSVGLGVSEGTCVLVAAGVSVTDGVSVGVLVGAWVGGGGTEATKQAASQNDELFLTGNSGCPLVYTVT